MFDSRQALKNALEISGVLSDEETSAAIVALLTSAIHDNKPRFPLSRILHEISKEACADLLDPLNTLPLLLPCSDWVANDLISLMCECSPAKEVVMAVQEAVEGLEASMRDDEEEDPDHTKPSISTQLDTLIRAYSSSIPRVKLRQKTPSQTVKPLLQELEGAITLASTSATRQEGRSLIVSVCHLACQVAAWAKTRVGISDEEVLACNKLLKSTIDTVLEACEPSICSSSAQRSFEHYFPRWTVRSAIDPDWEGGHKAVIDAIDAYRTLGFSATFVSLPPSTSEMVLLAHSDTDLVENEILLPRLVPILVASIQSNSALDGALAVLLKFLHTSQRSPWSELSPDVAIPLCTVIPPLSSLHPDPLVRHQAFRILSLLLSISPPALRLQILNSLASDDDLPQMRVAAVGLVKETLIEVLSMGPSLFSSAFLQTFGPVLLRPSPPDLFSSGLQLNAFLESSEPQRLTECLSLYYVILQRDTANLTGIRDVDVLKAVETNLLEPLRLFLTRWLDNSDPLGGSGHEAMPLVSLKIGLERVDAARASLLS